MSKHQNIIELNGRKYDTKTGKMVTGHSSQGSHAPKRSIDGVVKTGSHPQKRTPAKHHTKPEPPTPKPTKHISSQRSPKHVSHHKAQKSKSLMRSAVKKPAATPTKPQIHAKIDHSRAHRAKAIERSPRISKFPSGDNHKKSYQPLSVAPHPEVTKQEVPHKAPTHEAHKVSKAEAHFNKALELAKAHEEKPTKKQKRTARAAKKLGISRKVMNVSAAMLSVLLLIGFFTYQNLASLSMQVASSRAGFDASLPAYQPSGFAMSGPVEYGPGFVKVSFASHTDDSDIKLTQTKSNWNSTALAENYLTANNKDFQTLEQKGRTMYLYDDTNLTWVSGGVWYNIETDANIYADQLLQVANSI